MPLRFPVYLQAHIHRSKIEFWLENHHAIKTLHGGRFTFSTQLITLNNYPILFPTVLPDKKKLQIVWFIQQPLEIKIQTNYTFNELPLPALRSTRITCNLNIALFFVSFHFHFFTSLARGLGTTSLVPTCKWNHEIWTAVVVLLIIMVVL